MNISKLKHNPKIFARLFGIEPDKFDELVVKVKPLWIKAETKRLKHPRKIRKGSGRPYRLTLEENIAMLLLYARSYVTHAFLSALFDTHESGICRYFARLRPSLEAVFNLPTKKIDLSEEEILMLVVDATEQRTERRKKGCGYSGKQKAHTIKTQIVVDKKGDIRHISESVSGNIHDKKLFDKSGVKLPGNAKGDLGYLGTNIVIPIKSSKLHSLTQRQKDSNKRFSKKRIVVEHVFASLKSYRILADRFRGSLANYHQYFSIVCGLRNLARS
ncbi:MAG: transposase [Candidatus Gribaldobacteria bacterium]|nr:transposase [Candidatus Gribaldobacteria bacterium]